MDDDTGTDDLNGDSDIDEEVETVVNDTERSFCLT